MNVLLRNSLEAGKELEMIYLSDKGELTQRRIKVLEITPEHIRVFCFLRKKQRIFKLSNILSIGPVRPTYKKGA